MRILNRVSPGEAITAQAWNALVECCMEMQSELKRRRLSVGDGLELSESSCGTTERKEARIAAGFVNGGMDGTRTRDLLRDRQAL